MVFTSVKLNDGFMIEKPNIFTGSSSFCEMGPLLGQEKTAHVSPVAPKSHVNRAKLICIPLEVLFEKLFLLLIFY